MEFIGEYWDWLTEVFASRESLRLYIESHGSKAPLAFVMLQAIQVVLAPIPGEMTGSVGGFIFGGGFGALYATTGLVIGSTIAYILGRFLGRPFIKIFVSDKIEKRFQFMEHEQGYWVVFVIFVIPGFPKDILTYLVALSPMKTLPFLLISNLGRLPGTVMLTYAGAAAFEGSWPLLAGLGLASLLLLGLAYRYRGKIIAKMNADPKITKKPES